METLGTLRFMTFNIRHGRGLDGAVRLANIAETIHDAGAEIIALQEVDRYYLRSGFRDQIRYLANRLGMSWCFAPSIKVGFMQYGNAILSKFPVARSRVKYLPGFLERRSILVAEFDDFGERPLQILNTHLGWHPQERKRQADILQAMADDIHGPSVVLGDFNMCSMDIQMHTLSDRWKKVELAAKAPTHLNGKEIDHIMVDRHFMPGKAHTIETTASDHNPVVADLRLIDAGRSLAMVR